MAATSPAGSHHAALRPRRASRRVGYVAGASVNALLLVVLHAGPGWRRFDVLSERFGEVVGLLTVSLVLGLAIHLIQLAMDPPWLRKLGDAVTALLACIVLARVWAVFPFVFSLRWASWETPLRVAIAFLCIASGVGVVSNLAELVVLRGRPGR